MSILTSGVFWGGVVIIVGLAIILKAVFNIRLPIFSILFGAIFIYIGVSVIMHGIGRKNPDSVMFGERTFDATDFKSGRKGAGEFNVLFGKGTVDLSRLDLAAIDTGGNEIRLEVNVVFGGGYIKLNPAIPTRIQADTAFGGVRLPNGNTAAFGTTWYESRNLNKNQKHLLIKASTVFGGLEIDE